MKIKILRPVIIKGEIFSTDKIIEVENNLAFELIANYKAIKIENEIKTENKIEVEKEIDKKKVKTKKVILEKK